MSLRIAMVAACPYPVPQGSQVLLRDTAEALQARGHEVRLVVYGYGVGKEAIGVPVHRCARVPGLSKVAAGPSLLKPLADAALVLTARRVVREHEVDIVHAHNYEGLLVSLAALSTRLSRGPFLVYHAHNAMVDELPYFLRIRWAARALGRLLDGHAPRRAWKVIAPHHALAEYLVACGCLPRNITVLPPPCNAAVFDEGEIAPGVPPILYTGNLDLYQNLAFLQRVMHRVLEAVPVTRLRVATSVARSIPGAEMVSTPDFDALRRVLVEDAVVVCPRVSWSGYPIKLLNAMAAGKAIVACRSSAHPITASHDGLVVDDNDEDAFAKAVVRLLTDSDLRRALGRNARKTIIDRHSPTAYATALEGVYESPGRG